MLKRLRCLALFLYIGWGASCTFSPQLVYVRLSGMALGTTYRMIVEAPRQQLDSLPRQIALSLHAYEESLSTYRPHSVISRLNDNSSCIADSLFRAVFVKAREIYDASDGMLDITVTPLVNAWGFGFTGEQHHMLSGAVIDSLMQFVGMDKAMLVGDSVVKAHPSVMFNMNAIAKGYAADVVARDLDRRGYVNYMIEIGGEIRLRGVNEAGRPWRIGIDCPIDHGMPGDSLQAILSLTDKAVATSGNYRQFFEVDGVRFAHTINPKTGYPTQDSLLSVTIIADDAMTADGWATACMASGYVKSLQLLAAHPELDALLIVGSRQHAYTTFMTPGMQAYREP